MLLMSGAVVGTLGFLGSTLAGLIIALVVVRGRRHSLAHRFEGHDVERELADLTSNVRLKSRHPWTYRLRMIQRKVRG